MTNQRSLIMPGHEVRHALENETGQFRRACRDQAAIEYKWVEDHEVWPPQRNCKKGRLYTGWIAKHDGLDIWLPRKCPYGVPGDVLWVKETFHRHLAGGVTFRADADQDSDEPDTFWYMTSGGTEDTYTVDSWKPSIHMSRKFCRLRLEVTAIRVEQVQEISLVDINAEGISKSGTQFIDHHNAKGHFARLWDSINAKRKGGIYAWDKNPPVWRVEYKRRGHDPAS